MVRSVLSTTVMVSMVQALLEWLGCFLLFFLVNLCSSFCVKSQWKCHFVDYSGPLYV